VNRLCAFICIIRYFETQISVKIQPDDELRTHGKPPGKNEGKPSHTMVPCWMTTTLPPPRNPCTGCFAPTPGKPPSSFASSTQSTKKTQLFHLHKSTKHNHILLLHKTCTDLKVWSQNIEIHGRTKKPPKKILTSLQ
jgi:hypothetical protein